MEFLWKVCRKDGGVVVLWVEPVTSALFTQYRFTAVRQCFSELLSEVRGHSEETRLQDVHTALLSLQHK